MASDATRDSLLDAAKRVMQRDGAGHLTLDAVAKEAGVSKGGLLYHFPSKSDLLRGMIAAGGRHWRNDLEAQMALEPGPKSFARAYLRLAMFGPPDKSCKPSSEAIWSMIGATANDPSLLSPMRETHEEMRRRLLEDGLDADVANLVRFIGHGLWMTEIFGFASPTDEERARLYAIVARMAGFDTEAPEAAPATGEEETKGRVEKHKE